MYVFYILVDTTVLTVDCVFTDTHTTSLLSIPVSRERAQTCSAAAA